MDTLVPRVFANWGVLGSQFWPLCMIFPFVKMTQARNRGAFHSSLNVVGQVKLSLGDGLLLLYHVIPTLLIMSFPPLSKILPPTTGRGSLAASMDRFYCIHDTFKVVPPNDGYVEITNIFHCGGMPMANTSMPMFNRSTHIHT